MTGLPLTDISAMNGKYWSQTAFGKRSNLPLGLDLKMLATEAALTDTLALTDFSARLVKMISNCRSVTLAANRADGKLSGKLELNNANGTVLVNGDLRLSGGDMAALYQPENFAGTNTRRKRYQNWASPAVVSLWLISFIHWREKGR